MEKSMRKNKKGQVNTAVGAVIFLVVGIGIAVMVLVFVGSLSGQTYDIVEDDINAISNTTVKSSINNGIVSSFEALETTGEPGGANPSNPSRRKIWRTRETGLRFVLS